MKENDWKSEGKTGKCVVGGNYCTRESLVHGRIFSKNGDNNDTSRNTE